MLSSMQHHVAVLCALARERQALADALVEAGATPGVLAVPTGALVYTLPVKAASFTRVRFALALAGQGNDEAQASTAGLIAQMRDLGTGPDLALLVGTATALSRDEAIGRVVVPTAVRLVRCGPNSRAVQSERALPTDPGLLDLVRRSGVLTGGVVSSNDRARTSDTEAALEPLCHDMESGGFLAAAQDAGVPALAALAVAGRVGEPASVGQESGVFDAAMRVALRLVEAWRLRFTFDADWAPKVVAVRDRRMTEMNAERCVQQLLDHITGDAEEQVTVHSGSLADIVFTGGVIEVQVDLRKKSQLDEGVGQIERYLPQAHGGRGVRTGYVTDGVDWRQYELTEHGVAQVDDFTVEPDPASTTKIIDWLGAGLAASQDSVPPTPANISVRLGAGSPGRKADKTVLADMWADLAGNPEAHLKRELWARALRTALGSQFTDDDGLFLDHTYLVLLAELIADRIMGVDLVSSKVSAASLVNGDELKNRRQISGVVEADFFDWPLLSPVAESFIKRMAKRVTQFDWDAVEHDVLKFLYESVIPATTRKALGEYYTPDWLAQRVIDAVVTDPLRSTLDPACGSGTFLFHAVRKHLAAAEAAGMSMDEALHSVTDNVMGFDLHPVSVALARVTYLLAIGSERLSARTQPIRVPVFLADSLRWDVVDDRDAFRSDDLYLAADDEQHQDATVSLPDAEMFAFPAAVAADPARFDQVVTALERLTARQRRGPSEDGKRLDTMLDGLGLAGHDRDLVAQTAGLWWDLVDRGRDAIWGYYLRNQARPAWLAAPGHGVDYLVGNPPWLKYSSMPADMQKRFKDMCQARGLWTGGKVAHSQDLSGLFVARSVELYLKPSGGFGFVMPDAVLRAQHFDHFRSGDWSVTTGLGKESHLVALGVPWDVGNLAESFPITSAVIVGRDAPAPGAMPEETEKLARVDGVIVAAGAARPTDATHLSPWADRFRQGATLVPRMIAFVEISPPPPGAPATLRSVTSRRSTQEKEPWRSLPPLAGTVEAAYLFPTHLGETVLPYRTVDPLTAVLPLDTTSGQVADAGFADGMSRWWQAANDAWDDGKTDKDSKTLLERLDYFGNLSAQLPLGGLRVVYTKSGNQMAAALVDGRVVIDHTLYWAAVSDRAEGHYVLAVLNSETLRARTEAYQARGLFGPRHFDKYIFVNPIPPYDPADPAHVALAALGARAEAVATAVDLPDKGFQILRRLIREALAAHGVAADIDAAVTALLDTQAA